jgi:hypothetical protein
MGGGEECSIGDEMEQRGRKEERKKEKGRLARFSIQYPLHIAPPQQRRLFIDGAGFHGGHTGWIPRFGHDDMKGRGEMG